MALTEHGFNWKTSPSGLIIPAHADNPTLGPGVVDVEFEHKTSGLAAGSYGDASHYPAVTVDAYGHVTGVTLEASGGGGTVTEADISLSDVTTDDVSTSKHGFAPKAPGDATKYLDGTGAYSVPAGGGGGGGSLLFGSTLGADTATIDTGASGIAAGYNILEIFIVARTTGTGAGDTIVVTFNGDTGTNYQRLYILDLGTTLTGNAPAASSGLGLDTHGSGGQANVPGIARLAVPGYALTTFYKTVEYVTGRPDTTTANNAAIVGRAVWLSTAAISQITFVANGTSKFKAGSSVFIYGR